MNTDTPAPLEDIAADLVRRGLPVDYAQRAAAEFADHHRDLVDELQRSGLRANRQPPAKPRAAWAIRGRS